MKSPLLNSSSILSAPLSEIAVPAGPTAAEMAKGMILFALGIMCYSIYTLTVKICLVTFTLNVPEVSYYISFIMVGMFYILAKRSEVNILAIKSEIKVDLFLRTLFGFAADLLLFVAFTYTTYSRANCIFFAHPMMLPFFAKALVGEKIKTWDLIGIVLGLSGTLLLVQPWKKPDSNEDT
jgi:drug/metabolite transporter (DMT)-like permease